MLKSLAASRAALLLAALALAAACGDDTATSQPNGNESVLAGLSVVQRNDTAPSSSNLSGSGYFRGTVMAPALPGAGNDSLATSPRIAGVVVTIYPRIGSSLSSQIPVGPAAGSTVTNAQGQFTLPTLPAGEYVVTFVPPAGSTYAGSYAFGPLRSNSSEHPWWVVLNRK